MKKYNQIIKTYKIIAVSLGLMLSTCIPANILNFKSTAADFDLFSHHFMKKKNQRINNRVNLLFVQHAVHGQLSSTNIKPGCKLLKVWPIDENIHYFTDEPIRMSGTITPEHFVQMWQHQKKVNGKSFMPNVAMEGLIPYRSDHEHGTFNSSASLGRASYNKAASTMSYVACPLENHHLPNLKQIRHLTIFFDQFTPWPPNI